jgi:predicted nucleotidyltransferase
MSKPATNTQKATSGPSSQVILDTLSKFAQERQEEFGITRLGVFGSAARGTMSRQSDIDVVVELLEPDLLIMVGIKQELEEILQRPVDIVRYRSSMNNFLRCRIDQEAVYV